MKFAHIQDGVALTKFLYWIKQKKNFGFDELFLEKKLESFRKKNRNYIYQVLILLQDQVLTVYNTL